LSIDPKLFRAAADRIDRANEIVIVSHRRPDGDAIGSTVAILDVLSQRGRRAWGLLLDSVPLRYRGLVANGSIHVWTSTFDPRQIERADAVIVVDAASWEQIDVVRGPLAALADRMIVVDHHETHDGLGAIQLIDSTAAASGLIVYEWFTSLGWPFSIVGLNALFAALATDTGWFRFSNTDARALRAAAEMVQAGVRAHQCYEAISWSEAPARLALTAKALDSLSLHSDQRLAIMRIDQAALAECGASRSDTEDVINEPMRIGSVIVSALLVEEPNGRVRVSLRSKGQVNVAELAASMGGGGHARAAGLHTEGPMSEAYARMIALLSTAVEAVPCNSVKANA